MTRIPSHFKAESYSIRCVDHVLCVHASLHGPLGGLCLMALTINAATNMGGRASVLVPACRSRDPVPRHGAAGFLLSRVLPDGLLFWPVYLQWTCDC